ncbi:MAG: class I SAM-dependent methyltransferase [Odoribacter sp.]|nr:class I SAM-dependent methyltransferase [Odoribacter sp.]
MPLKINDQKPTLYQKTESNIWTDSYIQKQMLKEHLNFSSDGASRRLESIQKITDFIVKNTLPQTTLLDLGCGPGLYTSFFKDKGYEVTGIDFNKASIEYARQERKDIQYIIGDYIKDYPKGNFDTIIMIYCDMGTHSDNDRNKLLHNIYQSLNKDGKLIFDVFTEKLIQDRQESKSWEYAPAGGFWSEEEYLLLTQTFHYPENRAFAYQYNLVTQNQNKHFIVWEKYFSEEEIKVLLKDIGFNKVSIYKNILGHNNFTSDGEMFIIAEK